MTDGVGRPAGRPVGLVVSADNSSFTQNSSQAIQEDRFIGLLTAHSLHGPNHFAILGNYPHLRGRVRTQVLAEIVRNTIENPQHPYYSVGAKQREEMRRAIVEQLEPSHYLSPSRLG